MPVNADSLEPKETNPDDIKMNKNEKIGFTIMLATVLLIFLIGFATAYEQNKATNSTIDFLHQHGILSTNQESDKWKKSDIRIHFSYIYVKAKTGTLRLTYLYDQSHLTISKIEINQPPYPVIWEKEKWKQ